MRRGTNQGNTSDARGDDQLMGLPPTAKRFRPRSVMRPATSQPVSADSPFESRAGPMSTAGDPPKPAARPVVPECASALDEQGRMTALDRIVRRAGVTRGPGQRVTPRPCARGSLPLSARVRYGAVGGTRCGRIGESSARRRRSPSANRKRCPASRAFWTRFSSRRNAMTSACSRWRQPPKAAISNWNGSTGADYANTIDPAVGHYGREFLRSTSAEVLSASHEAASM